MVEQRSSKKHSNKTQEEKGSIIDEDPQIKKKRESAASILSDNLSKPELYIRSDRDYEGNALQLLKYKLAKAITYFIFIYIHIYIYIYRLKNMFYQRRTM